MARLDEITELLTDELDGLKQMLVKLETLSKELTGSETVQDISTIRKELKELNRTQEDYFKVQDGRTIQIEDQLKKSQIIPEWLLFMVSLVLILSLSISGYLGYQVVQFEEEKVKAFEEGKVVISKELNSFFKQHPDIYKGFLEWSRKAENTDQN
ncbi:MULTISPECIES: DUF6730 family protein [Arenibacter]|uniref:Uncharacterized protein n=1 Tax=Arenibacter palladensis TaxID=237373 RepID=A0A1M4T6R5_9FLAO|nr:MULTISPECIES: DUF6730 family protein [Arenibacter]MCK0133013.1 hypothetical protein [Arenibacter sp. S6351L]SHE40135.1 hypothetical protein SAMN03080594_101162 [Arenibacter palladensis]